MKPPLYIAWHTPDAYYTEHAMRLRASLEKFGLDFHIEQHEYPGSWARACFAKAYFILKMLDEVQCRNLVYIDADGEIMAYPELLDRIETDIAFVENAKGEPIASMIYFQNNELARIFLSQWSEFNKLWPNRPCADQENFGFTLERADISKTHLPTSYNFELGITEPITEPIVIRQHIASKLGVMTDFEGCHALLQKLLGAA